MDQSPFSLVNSFYFVFYRMFPAMQKNLQCNLAEKHTKNIFWATKTFSEFDQIFKWVIQKVYELWCPLIENSTAVCIDCKDFTYVIFPIVSWLFLSGFEL